MADVNAVHPPNMFIGCILFTFRVHWIAMNKLAGHESAALNSAELRMVTAAIESLASSTGLTAELVNCNRKDEPKATARPDAALRVDFPNETVRFFLEVKAVDRFSTIRTIKSTVGDSEKVILITRSMSPAAAELCRSLDLPFLDSAGNAFIRTDKHFVFVSGRRIESRVPQTRERQPLTVANLQVIFALLVKPDLLHATHRDISSAAGVSLGSVTNALDDLERRGFLADGRNRTRRRLVRKDDLREKWAAIYADILRPKLQRSRFTSRNPDWWRSVTLAQFNCYWGGEAAANLLTSYLQPKIITIYTTAGMRQLVKANRLVAAPEGEIEILEAFWGGNLLTAPGSDIAPALLVYADLLGTEDPRNLETARIIKDRYLDAA